MERRETNDELGGIIQMWSQLGTAYLCNEMLNGGSAR